MVRRWHAFRHISHEVRHDHADASLFIIEHNGCAAGRAGAQLQRSTGILVIERLTIQTFEIIYFEIRVIKKDNMSGSLPGHAFTDGAVTNMIVNRVFI
ncbi:MAG: hypothetical protein A3G96_06835 [Gammaproteobacteria bacterium RIFCSPLOWO2_12_FULL_52_10]|nr:MAG: hypothetical protein A3G96_06835 [Gammaproteobacteria bacterium RIFCSPLOWO2_12_FULL_52_10]